MKDRGLTDLAVNMFDILKLISVVMSLIPANGKPQSHLSLLSYMRPSVALWLANLTSNHRLSPLWVRTPRVAMLKTYPNITLPVQRAIKAQL